MKKDNKVENKKDEKEYNFLFLVEEGGCMNSEQPYKVVHKEKIHTTRKKVKEFEKQIREKYPNNSVVYFSI